ncbi:MAG: hypothetical protein AAF193_00635 [Bacteroidota bacterium]
MVRNRIIEQRIEIITESLEEGVELDYTTLLDDLNYYYDQNINLNNATQDELASLYLLTDFQINALFNHLAQFGQLKQIWELQAVESWDEVTIYNILPFVTVNPPSELTGVSLKKILNEGKHDLFLRYTETLEDQRGYLPAEEGSTASRYLGDQRRYYARYRFTFANNLSLGFTAEKDPGEEFFTGTQKNGFDFYSAHLFYQDKTRIRKLAVGDFQAQFGQGLTLWSGLAFGKTAAAMNVKRIPLGIRPYTSVDENRFLRGGAVTLGWGDVELTAFYSRKAIDANLVVDPDTTSEELNQTITSFQLTGFHRTENEIFDKDAIMETYMGANLSVKKRRWNVGVTAVASEFDADVERNLALYNQFDFNSNENQVVGVDYGYTKNNVSFFGETSVSANGGWATLNGLLVALHPKASVAIMQRHFTRDFQNPIANAFAESTRPQNEKAIYIGSQFKFNRRWILSAYADYYEFDWLRFATDGPSNGRDYLLQLNHKPNRKTEFYVRYRSRTRARNNAFFDDNIDVPRTNHQENFRINASVLVHPNVKLKSRVEMIHFRPDQAPKERGFLIYQDVVYKKVGLPISFSGRIGLFETDSFNARVYAYETDVLYSFSIPAYFSTGVRYYAMIKYRIKKGVDLWVRYGRWAYTDRQTVGTGLDEIEGPNRSDLRMQLRLRF